MIHPTDETAIRELVEQLLACWAAGDAEAYAALFTPDADYVAFDGVLQKGHDEIIAVHKPLFEKWLKGSRLTARILSLRALSPDVVLVHMMGNTIMAGKQEPEPGRLSLQTLVAVKQEGAWRFTAFHNTRVRPIDGARNVIAWGVSELFWKLLARRNNGYRLEEAEAA